jgi:hypothetical protein
MFQQVGFFENFAFLNALFLTMENQGFTSSNLWDKNILIIHHGRSCCYWPGTKLFSPTTELRDDQSGFKTYLEYIISLCSQVYKKYLHFALFYYKHLANLRLLAQKSL